MSSARVMALHVVGVMMAINTVPYVVSFFDWDVDVDSHKPH
jgi:hypothetical protein